jgi:hypothetical protein
MTKSPVIAAMIDPVRWTACALPIRAASTTPTIAIARLRKNTSTIGQVKSFFT